MKRRDFLRATAAGALVAPLLPSLARDAVGAAEPTARWYKGNLHAHSQWSDGLDLPEVALDAYKKRGYNFFAFTEHNIMQSNDFRFDGKDAKPFEGETSRWKLLATEGVNSGLTEEHVRKARELFGEDSVVMKKTDEGTFVRLKTYDELNKQFGNKDDFLLMPAFEMTTPWLHLNLINVDENFYLGDEKIGGVISKSFDKAREMYDGAGKPWLFMVNHPLWQYYNVQASDLIARPEIRFLEFTNNCTPYPFIPGAWTPESLWDAVNAYRASHDQDLLYGTGTDDSHGVTNTTFVAFYGWTGVRATELTPKAILDAMNRGDSYISTGLELEDVNFDGKTLSVKAKPEKEGKYRVEFFGTKKDYDPTPRYFEAESGPSMNRRIEGYSEKIGEKWATFDGVEGSYTLKSDDLYVRARVTRVGAEPVYLGTGADRTPLPTDAAWTQPHRG